MALKSERLHVRIAHAGLTSRRKAESLIAEGRVEVNGKIVIELGTKVEPEDEVRVDGQPLTPEKLSTVVMYKPLGVVTTMSDPQRRPTVIDHLPSHLRTLRPVGRLDMDTEGLLILTNDGDLGQRLAHPRFGIEKEYHAVVQGVPDEKALKALRNGVFFEGRKTSPAVVEVMGTVRKTNTTSLRMVIHEGRKRQIRRMCEIVGHPVVSLKRVRLGPLYLKGMRAGEVRLLGKKELEMLSKESKPAPRALSAIVDTEADVEDPG